MNPKTLDHSDLVGSPVTRSRRRSRAAATAVVLIGAVLGTAVTAGPARAATPPAAAVTSHGVAPLTEVNLQTYVGTDSNPISYTSTTGLSATTSSGQTSIAFGSHGEYVVTIRTTKVGARASVTVLLPNIGSCDSNVGQGDGQLDALALSGAAVVTAAIQFECVRTDSSNPSLVLGSISVGLVPDPTNGYYLFGQDGSIAGFGNSNYLNYINPFFTGPALNQAVVGMATTPSGAGYWLAAGDGGIFTYGDATFHGSAGNLALTRPIVGLARTPSGNGYWMVASDGGIFSFGDAGFHGSTGNIRLNQPIVGMAPTADGKGYWLVASDGGIFAFGDARFHGSMGGRPLNQPIVGMAATPDGKGYWLVASDGGIFAFGDAAFRGSTGNITLNQPIVGMTPTADGRGYWFTAQDGGVFAFGDAPFRGSLGAVGAEFVVGMVR